MERCPACRARLGSEVICPRCGCDCSLPLRAENQSRRLLQHAVLALAGGRHGEAQALAQQALALHNDSLGRAVAALVAQAKA